MKIELDNLAKNFGDVAALKSISLTVNSGEIFFFLGPSGCGKTTLLRLIAGFYQPDAGTLLFDGQSVLNVPAHKRRTAMVFQNYALWPHMTVEENVSFGLTVPGRRLPAKERRQRAAEIMAAMQLTPLASRRPAELSGGQQQRTALARALVVRPDCLLLDEPLSNLDAQLRQEMRLEIRRLIKQAGITALYVTHDQQEALSMADKCAVLKDGLLEQVGSPSELYEHPENAFVADFIGGANLFKGQVLRTTEQFITVAADGCPQQIWHGRSAASKLRFSAGQPVMLCVRPERLELSGHRAPPQNLFSAKITEMLYLGHTIELWLLWADKVLLRANVPVGFKDKAAGETVNFMVAPENVMVLPAV